MQTIVLVKVEMTAMKPTGKFRFDGSIHRPVFAPAPEAKACVWTLKSKPSDLAKAEAYAASEGYTVKVYTDEADPLGRARREALAARAPA